MSSWRDSILNDFVPNVSKLTLVADPDGLLTEEILALELHKRGFEVCEFSDPVEFRYAYELKYRSIWDRGENTDLVVILRLQDVELESLPYDLLTTGRKLAFDLGALFPNLSYPVVEKLDRSLLDTLFAAQRKLLPDRMGDNASMDFMLRHVFGVAAELISSEVDLLRTLLRIHYNKTHIPLVLSERLIYVLKEHGSFQTWPLTDIVSDENAFFAFLQERWPVFLENLASSDRLAEPNPDYLFKYSGPAFLPFDHQDIRVYIDNLFVEGNLTPIHKPELSFTPELWIKSGIVELTNEDDSVRCSRLFQLVEIDIPTAGCRHSVWINFAMKYAELAALVHRGSRTEDQARLSQISASVNLIFAQWLVTHYATLINLPPTVPAMLHHVPRLLARELEDTKNARVALLVIDGLALDQWVTVRHILQEQDQHLVMRESATFAWIPTLTSVSRQAIFSGKPPLFFPSSINSTNSEGNLWKQFWEGEGLSRLDVAYQRGLGDGDVTSVLDATLHPGKTKAVGLVVDKVDKIMHGMQLGSAGMHNQIEQWCQGGFLGSLIGYLLDHGYQVWMTSDHGNIQCRGKGRPSEGVIAETRGERVRIYPTPELRSHVADSFKFAYEWQPDGLPPNYFPLVAGGDDAFINPNETIVGHGGIAVEEVIVPLVKFERRILQ